MGDAPRHTLVRLASIEPKLHLRPPRKILCTVRIGAADIAKPEIEPGDAALIGGQFVGGMPLHMMFVGIDEGIDRGAGKPERLERLLTKPIFHVGNLDQQRNPPPLSTRRDRHRRPEGGVTGSGTWITPIERRLAISRAGHEEAAGLVAA